MGFVTKRITLDANGAGTLFTPPVWYVGVTGAGVSAGLSIANHGDSMGTAYLTSGTEKFVDGQIDITGGNPLAECVFLFSSQ